MLTGAEIPAVPVGQPRSCGQGEVHQRAEGAVQVHQLDCAGVASGASLQTGH